MWIGNDLPKTMEADARRGYCYAGKESILNRKLCARGFLTRLTNWQIFFTRLTLRLLRNRFPSLTWIGDGVKLDNMVHIAHNCQIGDHVVIAAQTGLSGGVVVGNQAIIGGQVGIGDKARIESGAVLGSGCGILTSKIVRAGQPVWGTPARPLREYLEQLALVARLPQMKEELRQVQATVRALAERLGLPQPSPDGTDRTGE